MTSPDIAVAARLIAKLLSQRETPQDEVPELIRSVHGTLAQLAERAPVAAEPARPAERIEAKPKRGRPKGQRQAPSASPRRPAAAAIVEMPVAPAPAPKLVRRSEVVSQPSDTGLPTPAAPQPQHTVRGIVKWFDPRTGKGALRLPGLSGDVPLEARLLADSGIARLFKGQEVDATLAESGGGAPQVQHLALPGTVPASPLPSGGTVRSRRAKQVLVELKREALRRVAARAEAEQLLGPSRSR